VPGAGGSRPGRKGGWSGNKGWCRRVALSDAFLAPASWDRRLRLGFVGIAKEAIHQTTGRGDLALLRQEREQGAG